MIPLDMFTDDVALMLNDVEIYNLATAYDLHCGIVINPGAYSISASVTFAFQKDFALTEAIDHQLKKLKESGILKHLSQKHFKKVVQDCPQTITELSFKGTFFLFAILASGVVLAVVSLIIEQIKGRVTYKELTIAKPVKNRPL